MEIHFSASDIHELFDELRHQVDASTRFYQDEQLLECPSQFCEGWIRQLTLRQGLVLRIQHLHLRNPLTITAEYFDEPPSVELGFCLQGQALGTLPGTTNRINCIAGQSFLAFAYDTKRIIEYSAEQPMLSISLSIELTTLQALIGNQLKSLPKPVQAIVEDQAFLPHVQQVSISPAMNLALQQVLNCPYQELTKRLYLESCALELTALYLEQIISTSRSSHLGCSLSQDTVERIYHAREILLGCLKQPPSLLELSRQVGLNDYTLKRGFREIFGTTAFGCLH